MITVESRQLNIIKMLVLTAVHLRMTISIEICDLLYLLIYFNK